MDLRRLKNEVQSLPNLQEQLRQLQLAWVKPLHAKNSPLLAYLDRERQQELRKQLSRTNGLFASLREGRLIQEKLQQQARYLLELKLSLLQGNATRGQQLIQLLLKDSFLSIKQTIAEVQQLEQNVSLLARDYAQINTFLEERLPLEGTLLYADLPHRQHLLELQRTAERQKSVVREIGKEFIMLTRSSKGKMGTRKD
ncbi:MAG: hypothetical protein AABX13_05150 [Nanoarchaeota archaeon]